jgi:hypothetical protein
MMMATDKAIYWLAVGAVALGLNSKYQQGEFGSAHRLADCAVRSAEHAAERGLAAVSMAEVMLGRNPADVARLQGALARLEARSENVPSVDVQQDLAQAQRDLEQMNVELQGMNTAVRVNVPCPEVRQMRHRLTAMTVPQVNDGELVVNGTMVDLRGLESLRSLETLQDFQVTPSMQSLESLRSLQSLGSMRQLRSWNHVTGGRLTIKVRKMHTDDGPI